MTAVPSTAEEAARCWNGRRGGDAAYCPKNSSWRRSQPPRFPPMNPRSHRALLSKMAEAGDARLGKRATGRVVFDQLHQTIPPRDCGVVRGAESAKANKNAKPDKDGTMVRPRMRTRAMSSGVGVIKPRVTQATSLDS